MDASKGGLRRSSVAGDRLDPTAPSGYPRGMPPSVAPRPRIGLSTYREAATWGVWRRQPADVLHAEYSDVVVTAGGVPLLLPPALPLPGAAADVVAGLHGLVISGGADIDPERYGARPHQRTQGWRPDRDAWETALLDAADAAGLPVLGVCRGMQLMAVHAGGALDQHTPDVVGHEQHSPGGDRFGDTEVVVEPASRVAGLVGERLRVRCHHHQSVARAPGLEIVARADDGSVEAIERAGDRFWVGAQWHPEMAAERELFGGLVEAAAGRA